ncbi:GDYXXLXY domain-containing protein [Bacillus solitudinis]|uniref:GDYXXLXY domain-containing protein n=1 Tax=Bacillus solitudinis TaxID=2014074 RepID=UPI000C2376F0|nr:GDYXXLXY domain-containing protein [Bacillus solitudinis]
MKIYTLQKNRLIDYTYILGLSLIIAAIVYFFAANWGGFNRETKIVLISLLILSFYGCSFLFGWMLQKRPLVDDVYEYAGIYFKNGKPNIPYEPSERDVIINTKANGWGSFIYGIESYFVEEGTGIDVEQNVTHAYVRVATTGNSLLVELE